MEWATQCSSYFEFNVYWVVHITLLMEKNNLKKMVPCGHTSLRNYHNIGSYTCHEIQQMILKYNIGYLCLP